VVDEPHQDAGQSDPEYPPFPGNDGQKGMKESYGIEQKCQPEEEQTHNQRIINGKKNKDLADHISGLLLIIPEI
jgi:hypothetical protein